MGVGKLKIVSSGTGCNTRIYDAEGKDISKYFSRAVITIDAADMVTVQLTAPAPQLEIDADGSRIETITAIGDEYREWKKAGSR
jgi:hypothetical protein